eukprot:CAMPEP_0177671876 /NCGR_PEP_ID=MMETSP0447-20121125/24989_1 /TAXON_ID=0 /ORGANISM="Stygamoeba regulata, Strain BSH-02190019" /LENGTH=302 /DNA_ID=CAMNT_0019179401 /DNA_START=29 /DNA_END=937 /DNA_ORIENTATION=-
MFLTLILGGLFGWLFCYVYMGMRAPFQSARRKLMVASWSAPSSGEIYGVLEIDFSNAQRYMDRVLKETGQKLTVTHMAIKAIGTGIAHCPSINSYLCMDRIFAHKSVDIGCLVAIDGGKNLANAKICNVDKIPASEIADILRAKADTLRKGKDADFQKTNDTLKQLPVLIIRPLTMLAGYLSSALGLSIPAMGVRPFPFGGCLVTSVGMLGLEQAFAPFTPFCRVPLLVMVGGVRDKPVVVDGKIEIRPILTITATIDHRFVDGSQAANLAKYTRAVFEEPEKYDDSLKVLKKKDEKAPKEE